MRRLLVPAAAFAAASLIAGCGSASPSSSPTAAAVTVSASPEATATPIVPTPTPTATPPVACMPGQFEISINNVQGAAGTMYATFEIRNTSTDDCTENGYAKLQMLSASGGELSTSWMNDNSMASPGPVDLPPGTMALGASGATGHGFFVVSWSDVSCTGSPANMPGFWQVTLPTSGFQTDVTATAGNVVCGGAIKVGPIKPAPYT
jgi:hypothetical protein